MRYGSQIDPPNRFETVHRESVDHESWDQEHLKTRTDRKIEYMDDASQSIVSENASPDIPFRYSLNPYRGCVHGCAYCYARPGHEYLGFNAGFDFETKVVVKREAPRLLREFLARRGWRPEPIVFSGVTDCYQPVERDLRLTRQCLEVALECRQPVSIVTKNALVVRDLEILRALAADHLVHVHLSITSLDAELARDMEPRTSIPAARLRAVRELADAGIPVGVMLAPVIPGLNDSEIPGLLEAAAEAGATAANYLLLRLPLTVETVFLEWVQRTRPEQAPRVLGRIRETRGGKWNSSVWGERMVGRGAIAEQIRDLFQLFRHKFGLGEQLQPMDCTRFRSPLPQSRQQRLF